MQKRTKSNEEQSRKAEQFRMLHTSEDMLILPCAWDVASAKLFEAEGYKAIGTTSAGVAAMLGYPDGQRIDFQEYLYLIRKIVTQVQVPVSVDIEAGFATTIEGVTINVKEILQTGAIGINIEDENHTRSGGLLLESVSYMVSKIKAIRELSDAFGVNLFINAKSDAIWLAGEGEEKDVFREVIDRANAYGAAGADCIFIPGDLDLQMINMLIKAISYPLNIVIKAVTPPVAQLNKQGVRRLSMGSGPMRATMGLIRTIARDVRSSGTYQSFLELAIPYDEVRSMFDSGLKDS